LKNKNRKIWKKKKIIVILNKFIIIKINLEVQNLKDIYLKYKPNKLFNRIIHFLEDSDPSFPTKTFSKKSINFCKILDLSKTKAQGYNNNNKFPENHILY
jgi:hypothetical protein